MDKKPPILDAESAYKYVLRLLNRYDKTECEIRTKLKERGYSYEDRSAAVAKIKKSGLLSDERYAQTYVLFNRERKGLRRIGIELERKGVASDIIAAALKGYDDESESAREVAHKFLRGKPKDRKTAERLMRHLAAKGYSYGTIKQISVEFDLKSVDVDDVFDC